jgi:autotransporter-associated beta strand protein
MSGIISGGTSGTTNKLTKTGAGTLAFTAQNTYFGDTTVSAGTLMIGIGGTAGGVSQNSPSIIVASGATLAVNRSDTVTQGSNALKVAITGAGGISQIGAGDTVLNLPNTYTGPTTVSAGTLTVGASNVLADTTTVSLGGGTLGVGAAFEDSVGTLAVTSNATIHLGDAISKLAFAESSGESWTGILNLTGTFVSGASLRFGDGSVTGLTPAQLASITATGYSGFGLDASGYLTASTASGFSSWIAGTFAGGAVPGGQQGANDDFDNDGISNLVEYAVHGLDPTVANASVGTFNSNVLSFSKRAATSGLTYAIEESTDLGIADDWTEVTGASYVSSATTISYTLTPSTPVKNFTRLRVLSN